MDIAVDQFFDTFVVPLLAVIAAAVGLFIAGGLLYLIHFLLTAPMRRAGRARLFLDLVETALDRGQPVEEVLISAAKGRDRILGSRFQDLAAALAGGRRLADALAMVPRLLPPQIVTMFKVGEKVGDLRKVLPACRQLLRDALSETRSAINYVVVIAFVVTPFSMGTFAVLCRKVMPVMRAISQDMAGQPPALFSLLWNHASLIIFVQTVLIIALWFLAFLHAVGPRAAEWWPVLHRVYYRLPWRRKRMNRDFSIMLATLLDTRVPEIEAVQLAAECTSNRVFQQRATRVAASLRQGVKLTEAIRGIDDTGEFGWRLTNATHATDGFRTALAGWHEALDAKAFQLEQGVAHGVTTALVLLNGVFVGTIVASVFAFLVNIISGGFIW